MFYDIDDCDIASNADDNNPYASSSNFDAVIHKLEESTNKLFQWFRNNYMNANADTCHLLAAGNYEASGNVNEFEIESSKKEKLFGTSIDTRLSFEQHITSRAFSSTLLRAIIARNHLHFFKISSTFLYFCPNFQIFFPFFALFKHFFTLFLPFFSEKSHACPYFLE